MAIVSETQIVKTLQQYNPWWHTADAVFGEGKPHKRGAFFAAMKVVGHAQIRRFPVLSGARRVGKTTIMFQMIAELMRQGVPAKNILYVSFDNPIIKMVGVHDVLSIYETLYPLEGMKYLFFDEIQYTDNWELWMKVIYDSRKDIMLTATGSASPVIAKGAADSGAGRWNVLKIPTMSFYEYCELLQIGDRPALPERVYMSELAGWPPGALADLMHSFTPLQTHFGRYLTIGGFPELALSDDDSYALRMLREDVVDKVIKRDVMTLFNVRNPLAMEKLFLYLCMRSSDIFNLQNAARDLENISVKTIEEYIGFLEQSNLIYRSPPIGVGSKAALKGKPKIYIADAAIRNAVLMLDDVLTLDVEMGITIETAVYKHIVSFYQNAPSVHVGYYRKARENQKEVDVVIELPREKILCEVKYRNNASISGTDAIATLVKEADARIKAAFVITKALTDYGVCKHDGLVPIFRIPASVFMYLSGWAEAQDDDFRL